MDNKYNLIVSSFGKDRFKFDEPLVNYTELKVGGPAKLFFVAFTTFELTKIVEMCRQLRLNFFIFGTGSKIMISDQGFDGLVIKNRTQVIHTVSVKGKATRFGIGVEEALIEVDSGVSINKFCEYLDYQSLSNSELLHIPGSVGGNLFLNRFLQSSVKSIKVLDSDCETLEISAENLSPKKHIILSAIFRIKAKIL